MIYLNRYCKSVLCAIIFSFSQFSYSANIVFDLYGVLVTQEGVAWQIGIFKFFGNFNPSPSRIQEFVFHILDSIDPRLPDTPIVYDGERLLPKIMCDFLSGTKTSQDVRSLIMRRLEVLAPGIDSKRKVKLVEAILNFMFTPELFAQAVTPIKKGTDILKKCYRVKDSDGNRLHKIFILTNWDKESFILLYNNKKIARMLDQADGIVVSGRVGYLKPCIEIFEYAFHYFKINPEEEPTFYIDDQLHNIQVARSLNYRCLKCLHVPYFDFTSLDKNLKRFGIY